MDIVADTSILISVITNEKHKREIVRLTENTNLVAPISLELEIGNAFSAMFKRKRINLEQALDAWNTYKSIPIRFFDVDMEHALQLSHDLNIYAYDAYFLVCAAELGVPLITIDKAMLLNARKQGIKTIEV